MMKIKTLLVTGLSGFVGQHLQAYLQQHSELGCRIVHPQESMELRQAHRIKKAIQQTMPDAVIHLAAQSHVPTSFKDPRATFEVNFTGTLNLLEALQAAQFKGRFLFVGSGDMYGQVNIADMPIKEHYPLKPRNPYAVSKVAAEALCYQWSQHANFDIMMARPFNHIGPKQAPHFAIADFAQQIIRIKYGQHPAHLTTGDIDVSRDFSDVRDIAAAYFAILADGKNGEVYNVGAGQDYTLRALIEIMLQLSGVDASISIDPTRLRPNEQRKVQADISKLQQHTRWRPRYTLKQTLHDILQDLEGDH